MSITSTHIRRHVTGPRNTITKDDCWAEAPTHPAWKVGSKVIAVEKCFGCFICRGQGDHFTVDVEEPV